LDANRRRGAAQRARVDGGAACRAQARAAQSRGAATRIEPGARSTRERVVARARSAVLAEALDGGQPIALFPVRLETRYVRQGAHCAYGSIRTC
jgi:hypothetical protein